MQEYRKLLVKELNQRKARNPLYSLRAFAGFLEISPALLSQLMSGKRTLTRKQASKIADKLSLSVREAKDILGSTLVHDLDFQQDDKRILKEDEFSLISEWYHMAILTLSEIPTNKADIRWIARKLGITTFQAREAFERLERLGLIEVKNGTYSQKIPLTTTTDIPSTAIRKHHKQNLDLAKEKIDHVNVQRRDFSTLTVAVNPAKVEKLKKMIAEFKAQVLKECEDGDKTEVYTLALQLFPITN